MTKKLSSFGLSVIVSTVLMAGGYKIPEQSLNSMALGAAYVAHTMGADTAYYNPANMAFMEDKQFLEAGLTLAHLPSNTYTLDIAHSGTSEIENILMPSFHYVSNVFGDFRWGVSLTVPGGLTKRWETPYQKASAEEFTLKIIELNPSMSYRISDTMSIGAGLRLLYSEGIVKSDASAGGRDMEGDTVEFGYNLALAYRPRADINMALTYRSNIDIKEEGNAKLYRASKPNGLFYDGGASVDVPLPAALNIAISRTWEERFTLEFNYERTFWSKYENLDFKYTGTNKHLVPSTFKHSVKNWKDTNTFRLGATVKVNPKLIAMFGFAIDETPAPQNTIGFELPDSDAKIYSMGVRYQHSENLSWGVAFLYDDKESIDLRAGVHKNQSATNVLNSGGKFSDGGAFLSTIGVAYTF